MERQPQNHPLPEGARPPFVLGGRECLWQIIGIAILAGVVVGIGVLSLLMPKPETSLIERRELAKRPDFTLENYFSGQWAEEMDLYYADTFPLRDTLVGWGSDLQEAYGLRLDELRIYQNGGQEETDTAPPITGSSQPDSSSQEGSASSDASSQPVEREPDIAAPGEVTQMSNGTVIYKNRAFSLFGGSEAMATEYARVISSYRQDFPEDVRIFDIVVPTAAEFGLPDNYKDLSNPQKPNIDLIYSQMGEGILPVDAYSQLEAHQDEYVYFRTDHHWTGLGAYYAYQAFCQTAGLEPVPLEEMSAYRLENFLGTLYSLTRDSRLAETPDYVEYYIMPGTFDAYVTQRDQPYGEPLYVGDPWGEYALPVNSYSVFLHGDYPLERIDTSNRNGRRAVVIKESFGNAFAPFLLSHYEQVFVVDLRYFQTSLVDLVVENDIDDVIFINNIFAANTGSHIRSIDNLRYQVWAPAPVQQEPAEEEPQEESREEAGEAEDRQENRAQEEEDS